MSAVKAECGTAARRAAGAVVLRPLTTMAALAAESEVPPLQDAVAEARRLIVHADYGGEAWAAIFSSGKYTSTLPGEGVLPATVVVACEHLLALTRARVVSI
eukprot:4720301-Pleurochrysis_carterae.AAC.1